MITKHIIKTIYGNIFLDIHKETEIVTKAPLLAQWMNGVHLTHIKEWAKKHNASLYKSEINKGGHQWQKIELN